MAVIKRMIICTIISMSPLIVYRSGALPTAKPTVSKHCKCPLITSLVKTTQHFLKSPTTISLLAVYDSISDESPCRSILEFNIHQHFLLALDHIFLSLQYLQSFWCKIFDLVDSYLHLKNLKYTNKQYENLEFYIYSFIDGQA